MNTTTPDDGEEHAVVVKSIYFLVQFSVAAVVSIMSTACPRTLACLFSLGMSGIPIAWARGEEIWQTQVSSFGNLFLKHVLVTVAGAIPLLLFVGSRMQRMDRFSWFLCLIALPGNILWTNTKEATDMSACGVIRAALTIFLSASLLLRCRTLLRQNQPLLLKVSGEYGVPAQVVTFTPLWLVAYTLWNISFTATFFGLASTPHDFTFWIMMYYVHRSQPKVESIPPMHFAGFSRFITLTSGMTVSIFIGQISWFREGRRYEYLACTAENGAWTTLALVLSIVDAVDAVVEAYKTPTPVISTTAENTKPAPADSV